MNTTADELRQAARADEMEAAASFDRCDTDGFLSQWAHGINARLKRAEARILDQGGVDDFPGLFDLQGNRVRAKVIQGRFGPCWAFCDAQDRFTGKFISAFPQRETTMARKGYREGWESAPAGARITAPAGARGLSGAASARVETYRKDKGYPDDARVEEA